MQQKDVGRGVRERKEPTSPKFEIKEANQHYPYVDKGLQSLTILQLHAQYAVPDASVHA